MISHCIIFNFFDSLSMQCKRVRVFFHIHYYPSGRTQGSERNFKLTRCYWMCMWYFCVHLLLWYYKRQMSSQPTTQEQFVNQLDGYLASIFQVQTTTIKTFSLLNFFFFNLIKVSLFQPTAQSLPPWLLIWNKAPKLTESWQESMQNKTIQNKNSYH